MHRNGARLFFVVLSCITYRVGGFGGLCFATLTIRGG